MPSSLWCEDTANGFDAQAANGGPHAQHATIGVSLRRWGQLLLAVQPPPPPPRPTTEMLLFSQQGPVRVIERAAAEAQGRLQGRSFETDNWFEVD